MSDKVSEKRLPTIFESFVEENEGIFKLFKTKTVEKKLPGIIEDGNSGRKC